MGWGGNHDPTKLRPGELWIIAGLAACLVTMCGASLLIVWAFAK